ncbi:hypothetical protein BDW68DRAFT_192564 [Aspergillus falconensis]
MSLVIYPYICGRLEAAVSQTLGRTQCREQYGFSNACIIGNRIIVTAGMSPFTSQTSPDPKDQVAQAFEKIKFLIKQTLRQASYPAYHEGMSGWEYFVKLRAYFVGLSAVQDEARTIMARHIKKLCLNHQPLFTMTGIESLPFEERRVELEVDVRLP